MRQLIIFLTILIMFQTSLPAHAEGWWDAFFPRDRSKDPAVTLQAPFADPDAVIVEPEEGSVLALNTPHRANSEISKWVEASIAALVIYDGKSFQNDLQSKAKYFDSFGFEEYKKFLLDANVSKTLMTGRYDVRGFSEDIPTLLNQAALNGRYRWLYQVPIMITFVESGATYKAADKQMASVEYIINLQIGRTEQAANELGIVIESWKAVPAKKDNKE